MICAIVPVYNEELRVGRLLGRLLTLSYINNIFVILNGSDDSTRAEVDEIYSKNQTRIHVIHFFEPLGIDVPRAVGANLAFNSGADYALFVDGDMVGEITGELSTLLARTIAKKPDLALTDCYPLPPAKELFAEPLFFFRRLLNQALGYERIGISSPSHGPHLVSRRMLHLVPWEDFCVPPTLLYYAYLHKLSVNIAASIPHIRLGSQIKNSIHSRMIVDTVSGDCLEALSLAEHRPRCRGYEGKAYLGYHKNRRFDLLSQFLAGRFMR
jgi:glycosyltransferase involved in cell wall biosynthesis